MRVLVTGAAGFVGSQVVRQLATQGHDVIAVDRDDIGLNQCAHAAPGISTAAIDLADRAGLGALLKETRPEAIIHLAWYADPADYLTSHLNLASLTMTTALVEAALAGACRKVVVGGSCVEYAAHARLITESDPVDPRTLYAACKQAAWQVARALAAEVGAELAWARIFHIHGPGEDRRRLIPWVASQLRSGVSVELTDGTQIRDHLHVSDVASGLVTLLAPGASGIYNVSSGEPVSLRHVLETIGEIVGGSQHLKFGARPHRPNETMFLAGDSTRLRTLGWVPRFGLREGLEDALRTEP
jgi:dTDP-6-deoxy-L-talose 4-dehydrogenase (NAD+)